MRVVHVIPTLEGGGAERQLTYLAGAQAALGEDVHLVVMRGGGPNEKLLDARCALHVLGVARASSPTAGARVLAAVRRLGPDVVHTWLWQGHLWGGAAARVLRLPWVFAERSSPRDFNPHAGTVGRIHVACGRLADAIVANSASGLDYWRSRALRRSRQVVLVPNGLPLAEIDVVQPAPAASLPGARHPMVLWAGRMDRNKNVRLVVDALGPVLRETDAWAMICGDGPDRVAAEQQVDPSQRDRVVFAGYRQDLWALMKAAALFVSMSAYEGNPNVVQEAMACRLPLVVSDIEAHRRVLDEGAALFVPPGDAGGLARAIVATLQDREGAKARARRARGQAEALSMEAVAASTRRVYEQAQRTYAR